MKVWRRFVVANLLVPMYGQFDFQGRIISFFYAFGADYRAVIRPDDLACFCCMLFLVWLALPSWYFGDCLCNLKN